MGVISVAIGRIECHVRARCQYIYALPLWTHSLGNKPTAYLTSLKQKAVLVLDSTVLPFCSDRPFAHGDGTQPQSEDDQVEGPIPTSQQWKWGDPTLGDMVPQHLKFLRRLSTPEIGRKYGIATKNNPEDVHRFCRQRGLLHPYLAYGTSDLLKAAQELTLLAMDTSRISHNDLTA